MELSLETLPEHAKQFVENLRVEGNQACVVGLKGNLGAGKTTFVQEVAKVLGVEVQVTSPTFVISQSYKTSHPTLKRLVHIDAYRLEGEEGDTIGFREYLSDPENLILVEWPENLPKGTDFPASAATLEFETVDENTRRVLLK